MSEPDSLHMTPEEFRRAGHAMIDWIARYYEDLDRYPVRSEIEPGTVRARLPTSAPEQGETWNAILRDLDDIIMPGITHWQSPRFFGYFPANASPPAVLGELVSAGLGVQGMLWSTSPACTELETHVLDWLVDMLALPGHFKSSSAGGGVIQDTASSATLCALIAARERGSAFATRRDGVRQTYTVYGSTQAHSLLEKAVAIAGLGTEHLRLVETDENHAMRVDALDAAIRKDRERGHVPCFICATIGTTSSAAIDPVKAIGAVAKEHDVWLHVDAALAGSAAVCPEFQWLHEGLDSADSYCFNPHKWLLTNFDCDCFYVADRDTLVQALSVLPDYLRNRASDAGGVIDYRDWHVPLGRRFRALKLWFVLRHYGVEGLRRHIRTHVALARDFAAWVDASSSFQLVVPPLLNLVCFRHVGDDQLNERLLESVNADGDVFLTHTTLAGRYVLRLAVGGTYTERRHVEQAWSSLQHAAAALAPPP
jgi:aromatic-L-amino-acid decarboxylase